MGVIKSSNGRPKIDMRQHQRRTRTYMLSAKQLANVGRLSHNAAAPLSLAEQ